MADTTTPLLDGSRRPVRTLRTRLLVRELFNGSTLVAPLAAPALASFGLEVDAFAEQEVFLADYLRQMPPQLLSRFSSPEGTHIEEIRLVLPRADLPRRMAPTTEVTIPCVIVPASASGPAGAPPEGSWVMLPPFDHVFYVAVEEVLAEVASAEVRRLVGALDISPWAYTHLLPASSYRIETLEVRLAGGQDAASVGTLRAEARRKKAEKVLLQVGTRLEVSSTDPPILGRDKEVRLLASLLTGRERLSVVLVGRENVGKSAVVRAFVAHHCERPVFRTSGAQLIAGMSSFGQWQQRLASVVEALSTLDAILYLDDLSDLVAERSGGGVDIPGALKAFMDQGRVRIVAELRPEAEGVLEKRHLGFFSAMNRMRIDPLDRDSTLRVLEKRVAHDGRWAEAEPAGPQDVRPRLEPDAIAPLVDLAERYLPYGAFPGNVVRLYEDLRSVREATAASAGPEIIRAADVYDLFSIQTGVPAFLLRDTTSLSVHSIAKALSEHLVGQREAVMKLAETIGVVKARLQPKDKPLATLLFVGPTGVGKTELARSLARYLFGSPDRMIRFDMSEFMSADAAERLIRGTSDDAGLLTRKVREQPFSVLLLDEIEKAHASVFDLLLQVAGEGRLTDARGQTTHFQNAIVIMTSNLGAGERRSSPGFLNASSDASARVIREVEAHFRQEFINRIDRIIPFAPLTRDEVMKVARMALAQIRGRRGLRDFGVALETSEATIAHLAEGGYSDVYGARALRRHLDEKLVAPLSRILAGLGDKASDVTVVAELETEAPVQREGVLLLETTASPLRFTVRRPKARSVDVQMDRAQRASDVRRYIDGCLRLPRVEAVRDQLQSLTTETSSAPGGESDPRRGQDMAKLVAEHHRLLELYDEALRVQGDVDALEELAVTALFEGQNLGPIDREAEQARERFNRTLLPLLVALEPKPNAITLALQELDDGALERWLVPFLDPTLRRRGWSAVCHLEGDDRLGHDVWPAERRWGPPRTPEEALARCQAGGRSRGRRFKNLLLRCRGPNAGVLLALETGLHRWVVSPKETRHGSEGRVHLLIHMRGLSADIPEDRWMHADFQPPKNDATDALKRGQPVREISLPLGVVYIPKGRGLVMDPATYWENFDSIALAHLLLFEDEENGLDRDELFLSGEDPSPAGDAEGH